MDIIVVGGGIVGMSTAWRLAKDGHKVTVLDRAATPGEGTSYANGGQLSYSYVAPLADSTIWAQLPKLLTDAASPVRFRPSLDPFQYRWLLSFLLACTSRAATRTLDRLGALAAVSRTVLHESPELQALDFSWSKTGKLVVYSSGRSFAHAKAQAERQASQGIDRRPLTVDGCIETEPALAIMAHRLVGGLYSPNDETGDARALAVGLADLLAAGPTGSRFLGNVDVTGFVREGAHIRAVETSRGSMTADMFVLTTGADTRMLARTVGADLPIYPIKGYSLTVPLRPNGNAPRVSVTDSANKVVYARIGETLRIAGAADLVGSSLAIDPHRIAMLMRVGQRDFPDAADWSSARPWAGLRPATPGGMPIVARTAVDNLLVNVGHGALGFTLALGTAELLAAIVAGRPAPVPADHFGR